MKHRFAGLIFALSAAFPAALFAQHAPLAAPRSADVVFLGELHDNPEHHARQAAWVAQIAPETLVFEMLTGEQAARVTPENRADAEVLGETLGWEASGWPDFAMYYPIFAAAPEARIAGAAVPREALQAAVRQDPGTAGDPAISAAFGLDEPLSDAEQTAREALQAAAHCDALPEDMLPGMVNVQRLRDATLAARALDAFRERGGPVVVITGNGHARADWGAPALLKRAAPDLAVFALGQGENGDPPGGDFDQVADAGPVDRGDPCDAFR